MLCGALVDMGDSDFLEGLLPSGELKPLSFWNWMTDFQSPCLSLNLSGIYSTAALPHLRFEMWGTRIS
jgi:hypothetical protein